ncbi:MAG: hypothetical protein J7496_08730 [Novosphingobium sp.]|nr:hypothetical protein [Novosphingobium sp.]
MILRTEIEINTGGFQDYSVPVVIDYTYQAGCSATYTQPGEADTVSLNSIKVIDAAGKSHDSDWLIDLLCDDDELLSLCALDWQEAQQDAAEYRAEARREDAELERWERDQ